MTHIRNSYEAEDISTYDRARTIGNSTGSLCGSSSVPGGSRYYSPPGTSYTIVERSHSPHYYFNSSGDGAGKPRGLYLDSLKQNGQKKRPISPERMFPTTSSSTPSSYHHLHTNGRNSPPVSSSSHQIYHRSGRDRSMITRTVTMVRDTQPDGTHGFGICVKGGRETGE
jgi:whirlin